MVYSEDPKESGYKCLTWRDKLKLLYQIGLTLQYLHNKNILHRDIKADNVMLDESFTVPKLIDFGLVETNSSTKSTQAHPKLNEGTLYWMPPEAFQGVYTVKSEVWSFGCLCYEVLTGRQPFSRDFPNDQIFGKFLENPNANYESLDLEGENLASLNPIIRSCIKYNPDDRLALSMILVMIDRFKDSKDAWLDEESYPLKCGPNVHDSQGTAERFATLNLNPSIPINRSQVNAFLSQFPSSDPIVAEFMRLRENNDATEEEIKEKESRNEQLKRELLEKERKREEDLSQTRDNNNMAHDSIQNQLNQYRESHASANSCIVSSPPSSPSPIDVPVSAPLFTFQSPPSSPDFSDAFSFHQGGSGSPGILVVSRSPLGFSGFGGVCIGGIPTDMLGIGGLGLGSYGGLRRFGGMASLDQLAALSLLARMQDDPFDGLAVGLGRRVVRIRRNLFF